MKKIYFVLIILVSFHLKAQYTITSASNPGVGDIESYIDLDSTGLFLGSSGISQTWNYSSAQLNGNPLVSNTYVPMSSVPHNSMFPTGTIGLDLGAGSYGVLSNTVSKFEYLGYAEATPSNCWTYSDPYKVYSLPFTYGSVSTDTYVLFQPTNITRGTFTTTGDGTGTLQLPTATIPNVLKLSYTIHEVDTTSANTIMNFTITMNQYYGAVSKFILLEVQTTTMTVITGTNVTTTYNKYGRIYSIYAPLEVNTIKDVKDLNIFPNPVTNGELYVSNTLTSEKAIIEIYNVLGQPVKTVFTESTSEPQKINLKDLQKGVYYLKFGGSSITTKKIIIE